MDLLSELKALVAKYDVSEPVEPTAPVAEVAPEVTEAPVETPAA